MSRDERFGSRLGMMLVMLGMAVGTGNIWRFPRIAAQNGGGEFLIAWVVFLFLWSIPLILLEFGLGRKTRSGPPKAFAIVLGPRFAWLGGFIALTAVAIMCYYSVVAGWTVRYALAAAFGQVPGDTPGAFWTAYTSSYGPVVTHALAIGLAVFVVARGVRAIEGVAKVFMPTLFVLVIILTLRAVTLPGAGGGLEYLFDVDWRALGRADLWLQALTQNAWDTGAGWGLALCYAAYLRNEEDTALNAFLVPAGNNLISLLAGTMVLCTVFSVVPALVKALAANPDALAAFPALNAAVAGGAELTPSLLEATIFGAGNEGLTFIWMPQLFDTLPAGRAFMTLFFVALAFAAFTSLVAMVELGTRVLRDAGMTRRASVRLVGAVGFLGGLPSALSLSVLANQDWVWGVALLLCGLFFALAVVRYGPARFRAEEINHPHSDIRVGGWWDGVIAIIVPVAAVVLVAWWLWQAREANPESWLLPFESFNVGTVLWQFAVAFGVLIAANRYLTRREPGAGEP